MIPPKFKSKDCSVEERPRKKLISQGSQQLSNAELLALLIESGNPQRNQCTTNAEPNDFS